MRFLLPLLVVAVLIASCFLPWITVESKAITITGVDTTGTVFGKPAYFHFFWITLFLIFLVINKVWARRASLIFAAFNFAWAARNFLLIAACQMGECPERRIGLYLVFFSSLALIFAGLISPVKGLNKSSDKKVEESR